MDGNPLKVTILYPCLNEEAAIADCVDAALAALRDADLHGEVLVVDNASTDASPRIAADHGARVVTEHHRGYGNAYLRGLREARGEYVIMLDADGTYPVELTGEFVRLLEQGAEFVLGNRFGGLMQADAMPFLNRYVGNPILSGMTRLLFAVSYQDMHCGMRGLRRDSIPKLALQSGGMEFATEMVVKALDADLATVEIPIPYRPRVGDSKLERVRDAWRHVEYMIAFSPGLFLLVPGLCLATLGYIIELALISGPTRILFRTFDVHANVLGMGMAIVGTTLFGLGVVSTHYAGSMGMRFRHSALSRWLYRVGDRPLRVASLGMLGAGLLTWATVVGSWVSSDFGVLSAVPPLTLGTALMASGVELMAVAFLVNIIGRARAILD
ncbi:MAG: glycosyltransferase family 2 protein [Oligoflexia bacterium]|nr:glycosyltransferase family 2 protein [Oligoflexia bacterium]